MEPVMPTVIRRPVSALPSSAIPPPVSAGIRHIRALGVEEAPRACRPSPRVLDTNARGASDPARSGTVGKVELALPAEVHAVFALRDSERLAQLARSVRQLEARFGDPSPIGHQGAAG